MNKEKFDKAKKIQDEIDVLQGILDKTSNAKPSYGLTLSAKTGYCDLGRDHTTEMYLKGDMAMKIWSMATASLQMRIDELQQEFDKI